MAKEPFREPELREREITSEEARRLIYEGLWNHKILNLEEAHEMSQGEGVNIAVLDSDIDSSIEELEGRVENSISCIEGDEKTNQHGTMVAGVLAGKNVGVALQQTSIQ